MFAVLTSLAANVAMFRIEDEHHHQVEVPSLGDIMSIVGIGVDIAFVPRFYQLYERYGERFLKRAYHINEIKEFYDRAPSQRPLYLASR